ncbi:MAG: hypothetical protein J2P17_19000 [Mycobacterium sp.]|nr:hypothetical protein [Mycobacterium sp.]
MHGKKIAQYFDEILDQAMFHGFTDDLRDYDVFIHTTADPRTGIPQEHLRYRFTHCVRATVTTALTPETWQRSLDERLIDYAQGVDLDGYVWGVRWQQLYPGARLMPDSAEAAKWRAALGISFYEAEILTNGHNIGLVFSDLSVQRVEQGHTPFVVPDSGPDGKIPFP